MNDAELAAQLPGGQLQLANQAGHEVIMRQPVFFGVLNQGLEGSMQLAAHHGLSLERKLAGLLADVRALHIRRLLMTQCLFFLDKPAEPLAGHIQTLATRHSRSLPRSRTPRPSHEPRGHTVAASRAQTGWRAHGQVKPGRLIAGTCQKPATMPPQVGRNRMSGTIACGDTDRQGGLCGGKDRSGVLRRRRDTGR